MAIDITQIMAAYGGVIYRAGWVVFNTNPRNSFRYKIKYLRFFYDDENLKFVCVFKIRREIQNNGAWILDIEYNFNTEALNSDIVNKFGTKVPATIPVLDLAGNPTFDIDGNPITVVNPEIWGTQFDRISVLFSATLADSMIVESYITELFNNGALDFPKNNIIG